MDMALSMLAHKSGFQALMKEKHLLVFDSYCIIYNQTDHKTYQICLKLY